MLAIFFVVQAYYGLAHGLYQAVLRMDDNTNYVSYQNIREAFNKSKPSWVYGHTFQHDDFQRDSESIKSTLNQNAPTCIYFRTETTNDTNVNFTKHYNQDEKMEKMESTGLYGKFFTTPIIGKNGAPEARSIPNGVTVSDSPGGPAQSGYKLLFSNYNDCAIIRPFPLKNLEGVPPTITEGMHPEDLPGFSYYAPNTGRQSIKPICVVLLSEDRARKGGMPSACSAVYQHLCGKDRTLKVIFSKKCPHIPNPLGC